MNWFKGQLTTTPHVQDYEYDYNIASSGLMPTYVLLYDASKAVMFIEHLKARTYAL